MEGAVPSPPPLKQPVEEERAASAPPSRWRAWRKVLVGNIPEPAFEESSLYMLSPDNKMRRALWYLTESNAFQMFIVLAILGNCVFLAMFRPLEPADSDWNHMLYVGEVVFLSIFLLEAVLKILAQGFVLHPRAYLRSGWNRLDALIILTGVLALIPAVGTNVSALRVARVLRPLKSLSGIRSLRVLVTSLLLALPLLMDTVVLVLFMFFIFGVLGVQLFGLEGVLHQRCVVDLTGEVLFSDVVTPFSEGAICARTELLGYTCPAGTTCLGGAAPNPNYGASSFDNIGAAAIVTLQCVTREGWADIMYLIMDGHGVVTSVLYFATAVIIGGFISVNLLLAVINYNFTLAEFLDKVQHGQIFIPTKRDKENRGHASRAANVFLVDLQRQSRATTSMANVKSKMKDKALDMSTKSLENDLSMVSMPARPRLAEGLHLLIVFTAVPVIIIITIITIFTLQDGHLLHRFLCRCCCFITTIFFRILLLVMMRNATRIVVDRSSSSSSSSSSGGGGGGRPGPAVAVIVNAPPTVVHVVITIITITTIAIMIMMLSLLFSAAFHFSLLCLPTFKLGALGLGHHFIRVCNAHTPCRLARAGHGDKVFLKSIRFVMDLLQLFVIVLDVHRDMRHELLEVFTRIGDGIVSCFHGNTVVTLGGGGGGRCRFARNPADV